MAISVQGPFIPTGAARGRAIAYALLVVVTMIWGSTFLVTRLALRLTHPFTFLAIRFSFASLLLCGLYCRRLRAVTRVEIVQGAGLGLVLFSSLALQAMGARSISASTAGFLVGLSIPAVPLVALLLLRRAPSVQAVAGIAISFAGLALLSLSGGSRLHAGRGEWLMIGAAIATALHIVAVGKYAPDADPINLTIVQITVTAACSLIMALVRSEPLIAPAPQALALAALMGLLATAFALVVMSRVQQSVCATRAALIYALEPMWAGLFGMAAGETLHAAAWGGCGLIFAGIAVGALRVELPRKRRRSSARLG